MVTGNVTPPAPDDEITARILDAAVAAASVHGVRRTSMSEIAEGAGISRPTLYKRFPSKDAVIAAVVVRETDHMIDDVLRTVEPLDDPAEALDAGVLRALTLLREHPLLDRVIRTEPETLVPLLVADPSPALTFGRPAVARLVTAKLPTLDDVGVRRLSDLLIRLLISYALTPPDDPADVVASSIASFLADGAVATTAAAGRDRR